MDLKEIKQILSLMDDHGITEFIFERKDTKLVLRRAGGDHVAAPAVHAPRPVAVAAPAAVAAAPAAAPAPAAEDASLFTIASPMVGTFYAAPNPDSQPYAKIGAKVSAENTVCIIEAMKIMNEIKADVSGTIEQICVKNGQPVEFGQALFKVRID